MIETGAVGDMDTALYVSTKNQHKLEEIGQILGGGVTILHPAENDPDVAESGETLWENALLKAKAGFERSGVPTIADDTGLEVDALNGEPGVYSSRFAGENASYEDNRHKLLADLSGVPSSERAARFRTVIAYVDGERELRFDGVVEGAIISDERGDGGFGYDPIFLPEGEEKTMAEMSQDEKNEISHRGRAFREFFVWWKTQE